MGYTCLYKWHRDGDRPRKDAHLKGEDYITWVSTFWE
jgi:hypothetical protein